MIVELKPQPGPQEQFLSSSADIVIYGGAAGGGKSFALLMEPLRHINNPKFGAVIFRKNANQITAEGGLWDTSDGIYPYIGGKGTKNPRPTWKFPKGAKISFAHLEYEKDKFAWQGSQIAFIGFDELTHFTESQFFYNEPEELSKAVAAFGSEYIAARITENATGSITAVAQQKFEGGTNPTVTPESYTEAFTALEPYFYNTIALDTVDPDIQSLLKEYLNEAANEGNLGIAVIGENGSSALSTRIANAKKINDPTFVYFGSDFGTVEDTTVSGAEAIATVAGVISSTPSNESIVHKKMPGAVKVAERLTNTQYSNAISNGLLLLSVYDDGSVVFDSGVTTLTEPSENQDEGWKKIKRVKVRHEAYNRLDRQLSKLIGKVNGDDDGISYVIQKGQEVLDTMKDEQKILNPSFTLDEENGYGSDYAYFIVAFDDIDTLERIFLIYQFKSSTNS
jgi:hypothetical protein